jgi:hypothetical protein
MRTSATIVLLRFLATLPLPLAAQHPGSRPGQWLGGGLGLGWARVACRICGANRGHSLSASAQIGGRLSGQVLLGGEIDGWIRNANSGQGRPADELMLAYSVVTYWYPSPATSTI